MRTQYKPLFNTDKTSIHFAKMFVFSEIKKHKKAMGKISDINFGSMFVDALLCN